MEKNSDNRISIKINGEERNFTNNKDQLSSAIQDSLKEIAAANEGSENDEFQWVLPNEEPSKMQSNKNMISIEEFVNLKQKQKKKREKSENIHFGQNPILNKRILLSILLAVLIGFGFGVFILKFISNESAIQQDMTPPSSEVTNISPNTSEDTTTPEDKQQIVEKVSYQFHPFTAFVVQAGVFSTTIETARQSLEAKRIEDFSYPLTFIEKEKIYLFMGIGLNLDDMKSLGSFYNDSGIETYSKSFDVEGKTIEVSNQEIADNLKLISMVYDDLLSMTSRGIVEKQTSPEKFTELQKNFKKIQFPILAEDALLKNYSSYVKEAYLAFEEYQENQNRDKLFQSQQALLNALAEYVAL